MTKNTFRQFNYLAIQRKLFTVCSVHLNVRKFLSNLVPQCLRTFCNGLLRFTRYDGQFTVHSSQSTQTACSVHFNARKFLSNLVPQCLRAFTLAETLIVIGIIGVVAALTLPNLNHATGDKEKVRRVKKIYSALTDAIDRAQAIYGPCDEWIKEFDGDYNNADTIFAKRITEFLKVSKDCAFEDGCFSKNDLLYSDGHSYEEPCTTHYTVLLTDGTALSLGFTNFYIGGESGYPNYRIKVDIDGPNKGKTQLGNDIFEFSLYTNTYNASITGVSVNQLIPDFFKKTWTGGFGSIINYTTAWVIQNDNLDYLKCPDELNWETQTSCK